jgi:transposase
MLYAGLDLSRKRLDFHLLDAEGATVDVGASPPDADGLRGLGERLNRHGEPIRAAIESMNGAHFVHDRLELAGWQVEIADAQKVKGLAPLACKTDRIDARVLAELARRDLVPAIWLPDPRVRAERERARWRLHLVRHRSSLKQRVQHADTFRTHVRYARRSATSNDAFRHGSVGRGQRAVSRKALLSSDLRLPD